jgi:hypothetical protein
MVEGFAGAGAGGISRGWAMSSLADSDVPLTEQTAVKLASSCWSDATSGDAVVLFRLMQSQDIQNTYARYAISNYGANAACIQASLLEARQPLTPPAPPPPVVLPGIPLPPVIIKPDTPRSPWPWVALSVVVLAAGGLGTYAYVHRKARR